MQSCIDGIVLFLSILFFMTCNPSIEEEIPTPTPDPGISSIVILDEISRKPVEKVKVILTKCEDDGFFKFKCTNLEMRLSDKNGVVKFSKTYYRQSSYWFELQIIENDIYFPDYPYVHRNEVVFYLEPKAWVRIHIKDLTPNDGLENLIIFSYSFTSGMPFDVSGQEIDIKKLFLAHSKDSAEIRIENDKNIGIIKYSIFTPIKAHDTLDIDIFFK